MAIVRLKGKLKKWGPGPFAGALVALAGLLAPQLAMAAASAWDQTEVTEVRLITATDAVGEGGTLRLGLQFRLNPGWKIYWRSPGDAGLPPVPDFSESTNLTAVEMEWPAPQWFHEDGGLETVGYMEGTIFPMTAWLDQSGAPVRLRAVVDYQACEKICVPFTATLNLDLPAGPAEPSRYAQIIDRYAAKVPVSPAAAGITVEAAGVVGVAPARVLQVALHSEQPFELPELFVEGAGGFLLPSVAAELREDAHVAVLRVPLDEADSDQLAHEVMVTIVDGRRAAEFPVMLAPVGEAEAGSIWALPVILLLALLGGLILNLMPCVLPVLSIKLLGVVSHGGGERGWVVANFLASASGIVVSFLLLAASAVALKLGGGMVGWGMQVQEPLFLVFLTIVVTLFACNLFGFYEINMPSWLGGVAGGAGNGPTLVGSFWTGALATLLATPCSAPFLGTAVGFALSRGAGEIFAVFFALGLGMASPYLLVAAAPGMATRLPRPGPWMVWVRRVMGLALIVTAIWLLWVISAQTGLIAAWILGGLALAMVAALWLVRAPGRGRIATTSIAALTVFAFLVPGLAGRPAGTEAGGVSQVAAGPQWQQFNESGIRGLVRAGQVVFVDVTADWCVTCKVNKSLVIDSAEIAEQLSASHVVAMRADWTTPDPDIARYLAKYGRYGIPFNVVYGPGAPQGLVLSELLSKSEVLDALGRARDSGASAAAQTGSRFD